MQPNAQELRRLYMDEGPTYPALADRYDTHISKIQKVLWTTPGFQPRLPGRRARSPKLTTPKQSAPTYSKEIFQRWLEGATLAELSEEFKIGAPTVSKRLRSNPDYEASKAQRRINQVTIGKRLTSRVDFTEMMEAFRDGETIGPLAKRYNVSRQRIYQILERDAPELLEERRRERVYDRAQEEERLAEKKAKREQNRTNLQRAIELYREGLVTREIKEIFPDINTSTFQAAIRQEQERDPQFPAERGVRNGRPYNWQNRTLKALEICGGNAHQAAKLIKLTSTGMYLRIGLMRARGVNI